MADESPKAPLIEKWFHWKGIAYPVSRIANVKQFEGKLVITMDTIYRAKMNSEYSYTQYDTLYIEDPAHMSALAAILGFDLKKVQTVDHQRNSGKGGSRTSKPGYKRDDEEGDGGVPF